MPSVRVNWIGAAALALLWSISAYAADDPCAAFTWDVHHERELFAKPAEALTGGRSDAAAPDLKVDRLYEVALAKQADVSFVTKPGKAAPEGASYAALVHLKVPAGGTWRISLDAKLWVDVLVDGGAIASSDFQGRPGCSAPHKIVEFVLPAGEVLTVQISSGAAPGVKLSVTRAPARAVISTTP
jgi:hypothetical protein